VGIVKQAIDAAYRLQPMNDAQKHTLLEKTAASAGAGEWEHYKTSNTFDGTAKHPWWLSTASLSQ
jgi:hypothetical protein